MWVVTEKGRAHSHWELFKLLIPITLNTEKTKVEAPALAVIERTNYKRTINFQFDIKYFLKLKVVFLLHNLFMNVF